MTPFMTEDFLLDTEFARRLYHDYAKDQPIFDYHCHLPPQQVAEDYRFKNLYDIWLKGDHYKWRAMRTNGVAERLCTGDASDREKFDAWAATVPHTIGNPLYHWTHLELQRYFGITEPLCPASARRIYDECNRALRDDPDLNVFGIFRKFNVYAVGTTDDPVDSLEFHRAVKGKTPAKVIPSFRPDKAINIDSPAFAGYIDKLSEVSGVSISRASDVIDALSLRLDHFVANGCLATDMALCYPPFETASEAEIDKILNKALSGKPVSPLEAEQYRTFVVLALGREYAKRNLVMQIHLQASRNNNSRQFAALGPDSGYDAVSDFQIAAKLQKLLDNLESADSLPKMILYSVNPNDYYVLGSLIGCFQKDVPGKLQLGSGWWFCDHIDGMTEQLRTLGDLGMLSRFVGMLTDSRSFLSYPRHEYFRRILCNLLGTWMDNGEIPGDFGLVGGMVKDISFANARCFFEN